MFTDSSAELPGSEKANSIDSMIAPTLASDVEMPFPAVTINEPLTAAGLIAEKTGIPIRSSQVESVILEILNREVY